VPVKYDNKQKNINQKTSMSSMMTILIYYVFTVS